PRKKRQLGDRQYDEFGMDPEYLGACGRLFDFLERYYWRIEMDGLREIPTGGPIVLVGVHRGFMPWDGIMLIHYLFKTTGRCPRFLMHPGLVKLPFLFNFMTKIGGVIACHENADRILRKGGILGIFPEGTSGAFTLYRDAYRLGKFGRSDFVKIAIRNRAPIVPYVTVGSAEIFPILKKFEWRWWKRATDWPCFPITPTFPFLPVPLPSKWHTQFLPAVHVEHTYPRESAGDPAVVRLVSDQVRARMGEAMDTIRERRKSIFWGSVFNQEVG